MELNDNQTDFSRYLKIGSWIITIIFVIFMFKSSLSDGALENIIETAESDEKREQYIEEKYGNLVNNND